MGTYVLRLEMAAFEPVAELRLPSSTDAEALNDATRLVIALQRHGWVYYVDYAEEYRAMYSIRYGGMVEVKSLVPNG